MKLMCFQIFWHNRKVFFKKEKEKLKINKLMPNQARYHGICKYNENTRSVVNVVSKAISK